MYPAKEGKQKQYRYIYIFTKIKHNYQKNDKQQKTNYKHVYSFLTNYTQNLTKQNTCKH